MAHGAERAEAARLGHIPQKLCTLGPILHGQPQTTNVAFGGPDWKTLYFTNWNFLGSVNLRIAGMPVPAVKKA